MIALASSILLIYVVIIVMGILAWKSKKPIPSSSIANELITVVVPFRNEENYLEECINTLAVQANSGPVEILLMDDHSTDNSLKIAQRISDEYPHIQVRTVSNAEGKKAAIEQAINAAQGNVILQTDADCIVPINWISTMRKQFSSNCQLLLGPVKVYDHAQSWNWINQLEMMTLQLITAGTVHYQHPTMANGANIMYRKRLYFDYLKSGIGQGFASGDDQHLLDYAASINKKDIHYAQEKDAIITTDFPCEWNLMVAQRARWASKNKQASGAVKYLGLLFTITQFTFPLLLLSSVFSPSILPYAWDFIVVKSLIEIIALYFVNQFFNCASFKYSAIFPFVYPFFLAQVALQTTKKGTWKNRSI